MEPFSYLSCKLHQESFRTKEGTRPLYFLLRKENNSVKKGLKGWKGYNSCAESRKNNNDAFLKKDALTKMLSDVFSTSKNVCRNDHDDGKLYTLICQLSKKEHTPLSGTLSVIIQILDLLSFFFCYQRN